MNDYLTRKLIYFCIESIVTDEDTFDDGEVLEIRDFFRALADEFDIEEQDGNE